ncbi:asparagine synthetase domain-containing protein CG17486 isoform X1 [Colias croceus]|uniref:asparagine synthetase domain-containing protein CG17486 isoform X1 n=1 Tax=Colias crocea TaxID=72248 RepID=UPI001E27AB65|nr:asparagine synthetase domain-containing protein CG17486 isoform X1 [Colias croceus]
MCGIICEILYKPVTSIFKDEVQLQRIKNRGPNCVHSCSVKINNIVISFCGAVLWTQGQKLTPQPIENEQGVLLFNGDIYDETWITKYSDTQIIMEKLSNCESSQERIIQVIKSLKGPFCIIYYDKLSKVLYFTRDKIGRGSLLMHKTDHSIVISSVLGRKYTCIEIPASNIYQLEVLNKVITRFYWDSELIEEYSFNDWTQNIELLQNLPDDEFIINLDVETDLNIEDDTLNFIDEVSKKYNSKQEIMKQLLTHTTILKAVQKLLQLLEQSVKVRLEKHPNKCKNCLNEDIDCSHCTVGILFSGGLDCTILAYLADKYVSKDQPIDLINVAFKTENCTTYDVPDRITGKNSYEELKTNCSSRNWVFREVNIPKEELEACQSTTIADLVFPRKTILDESLGSALWYSAWGHNNEGTSPCRVLLLGSGADELFGGYTRHRNVFKRQGWTGLVKELCLEWSRISYRNLARDNRVICDHGRIPRLPYLDEDFSGYVLKLKPWLRCFPSEHLGMGIGDKLLLRLLATHLGLIKVATLPKRALQFGSRIANKKQKGSDISKNLQ